MGHPMRLELTLAGLLVKLANHYTTRGAHLAGAVEYVDCVPAENMIPTSLTEYDTKPSDGEAPVLEIWRLWTTVSLPLLPCPL